MSKTAISKSFDLGNGQTITLETGKLATQADGAVMVKQGDCVLLATVVANKEKSPIKASFRYQWIFRKSLHQQVEYRVVFSEEKADCRIMKC